MKQVAVLGGVLAVITAAPAATADDDPQWVLRASASRGGPAPVAVFLSWDFTRVLFRATCDATSGEVVLLYRGDGVAALGSDDQLVLHRGESQRRLATRLTADGLEARVGGDAPELSGAAPLAIDAPNGMGEPWHVGTAQPLTAVADGCRAPA